MNTPDPALLADLDAGLLDPAHAREVRAAALGDPRATAVLAALRATRADLAALPAPAVPPAVAQRWLAALATADRDAAGPGRRAVGPAAPDPPGAGPTRTAAGPPPTGPEPAPTTGHASPRPAPPGPAVDSPRSATGPVTVRADRQAPGHPNGHITMARHSAPGRPRASHPAPGPAGHPPSSPGPRSPGSRSPGPRNQQARASRGPVRPRARRGRGFAVTALLAAAALVVGVAVAAVGGRGSPVEVTRVELAGVARSTIGRTELGVYTDVARLDACLATAGHAGAVVLGGRPVRLDGSPGVLLVLSTGVLGRFRMLVVDGGCRTLADDVLGG